MASDKRLARLERLNGTGRKTSTSDERRRVLKSIERWLLDNKDLCARIASTVERKEYLFAVPTMLRVCYDVEKMIMLFLR